VRREEETDTDTEKKCLIGKRGLWEFYLINFEGRTMKMN
jgi:hypothetical protein